MSCANLARPVGLSRPTIQRAPENRCGMAPHRGAVITVQAAARVRLQGTKRNAEWQASAPTPAPRTAGDSWRW